MTSFDSLKIKNQNQTAGALSYLKTLKRTFGFDV
jgi:hypothetical protein